MGWDTLVSIHFPLVFLLEPVKLCWDVISSQTYKTVGYTWSKGEKSPKQKQIKPPLNHQDGHCFQRIWKKPTLINGSRIAFSRFWIRPSINSWSFYFLYHLYLLPPHPLPLLWLLPLVLLKSVGTRLRGQNINAWIYIANEGIWLSFSKSTCRWLSFEGLDWDPRPDL